VSEEYLNAIVVLTMSRLMTIDPVVHHRRGILPLIMMFMAMMLINRMLTSHLFACLGYSHITPL
jgi:hypothetical protein